MDRSAADQVGDVLRQRSKGQACAADYANRRRRQRLAGREADQQPGRFDDRGPLLRQHRQRRLLGGIEIADDLATHSGDRGLDQTRLLVFPGLLLPCS